MIEEHFINSTILGYMLYKSLCGGQDGVYASPHCTVRASIVGNHLLYPLPRQLSILM